APPAAARRPRSPRRWRGSASAPDMSAPALTGPALALQRRHEGTKPGRHKAMTTEPSTVRRTLKFKFTLPTANSGQLAALLKAAAPFYEAFGGRRIRLLQNVDDPAR